MKIDFSKLLEDNRNYRQDWRFNFLIQVLTDHTPNANHWKETLGVDITKPPVEVDMKVTVNGHEIPFDKWIEHMENAYNDMLKAHAQKLVEEKVGKLQDFLHTLSLELDEAVSTAADIHSGTCFSSEWLLSYLAGMTFPEKGGAYDYVKKLMGK